MQKKREITLGWAARECGFRRQGYRVYMLRNQADTDGQLIAHDYELSRILRDHPELRRCRVAKQEDYYGITIFRVRRPECNG